MKTLSAPNDVLASMADEYLSKGKEAVLRVKGRSMRPFLRDEIDSVRLVKKDTVEVGDMVFARIGGSRYVLHRVIGVDGESLTLMGDGNIRGTESCLKGDVLGTVVEILPPDGRGHAPGNGRWWRLLLPLRRYILFILKFFGR